MTLRTRRILYSFFIAIFVIAAPTLVLYTAGFRYDFEYNRIVETGSLVVKSYPQNASIYINGELLENRGCEYRLSRRFNKSDGQLHHTETLTVDNLVGDTSIVIKYLSDEVMGDITIGDFTYQTDDTDEEAILARKLGSNVRTTFLETLEVRIPGLHALMNNPLITPRPNPVLGQLYPALRAPQV